MSNLKIGERGTLRGKTYEVRRLERWWKCSGCAFEQGGAPFRCFLIPAEEFGAALGECAALAREDNTYVCYVEIKENQNKQQPKHKQQ